MMAPTLPIGFNPIPAGQFVAGAHIGEPVGAFGMKATPVTNSEFGEVGRNQFVLLNHDWNTGETRLEKKGQTVEEVLGGPADTSEGMNFDQGDIMTFGSMILLKMVDNPSARYDEPKKKRLFSGEKQPVAGVTYFHAKAWCLLKTLESGGEFKYDLPTDLQYEYVASDRGTKEYGTETGTLFKGEKKLAHIGEYQGGKGTTVAVDDPRYQQKRPFDVDTVGNVWRWTGFNPEFKRPGEYFYGPYGLRGGSWGNGLGGGRAAFRNRVLPDNRNYTVGFSPVVVRQDSK